MSKRKIVYRDQDEGLPPWTTFQRVADESRPDVKIWANSRYIVHEHRYQSNEPSYPDVIHLSFRRQDNQPVISYQDMMRIKRELGYGEYDFLFDLPPDHEEIDTCHQYHLFAVAKLDFRWLPMDAKTVLGDMNQKKGK